jgi:hypothetical protein
MEEGEGPSEREPRQQTNKKPGAPRRSGIVILSAVKNPVDGFEALTELSLDSSLRSERPIQGTGPNPAP